MAGQPVCTGLEKIEQMLIAEVHEPVAFHAGKQGKGSRTTCTFIGKIVVA